MKNLYTCIFCIVLLFGLNMKCASQLNYVFSTHQSTYTYLDSTAVVPSLSNPTPVGYYEEDEGFANNVPIGFMFKFNGGMYGFVNVNVNGFIAFGGALTADVNERYHTNNLTNGIAQNNISGIIAPLWDDLWLNSTSSIKYKTTGAAPNRVFIVQWDSVMWNYNALSPAITFQLRLYEGSNAIEFAYKQLSENTSNANASIGISSNIKNDFLSVATATSDAATCALKSFDSINIKPATDQVYRFVPGACSLPQGLTVGSYNTHKINMSWNVSNSCSYDYTVSTSPLQPRTSSSTSANSLAADNLNAGTQYYIHLRKDTGNSAASGFVTIPFITPQEAVLPYSETLDQVNGNDLPSSIIPITTNGSNGWKMYALSSAPPYNNVLLCGSDNSQATDASFILPGMSMEGGMTYRLKFKYRTGDTFAVQKLQVRIGTLINNNFSGWSTIYTNANINNPLFKDTSFLFAPPADDVYFISFRYVADKNSSSTIMVDNMELSKVMPISVKLVYLTATKGSGKNLIAWKTASELNNKGFELQRGADGIHFTTIGGFIDSKAINGTTAVANTYSTEDDAPLKSETFYRLKITDLSGNVYYSQPAEVAGDATLDIVYTSVFPNPAVNIVTVVVNSPLVSNASFVMTDMSGKTVVRMPCMLYKGSNRLSVDVSHLGRGIYMTNIVGEKGAYSDVIKLVKQ